MPAHTYRLKFESSDQEPAADIEFEAEDAYRALVIAQKMARYRSAELWRDGVQICNIRQLHGDVWEVSPVTRLMLEPQMPPAA